MKTDLTFHEIAPGLAVDLSTLASLLDINNPDNEWHSSRTLPGTVITLDRVLQSFQVRAGVYLRDEWVGEPSALQRVLALCDELSRELIAYPATKSDSNKADA